MKILNIYYSATGNTEKIANTIEATAVQEGHQVNTVKITKEANVDIELLDYDFVFVGSGVYQWLPGKPLQELFTKMLWKYFEKGEIRPSAPKRPDKRAVIYCTYGGVHTGINEAIPAVKYMGQLFDHLGFIIVAEWYFVGEYRSEKLARFSMGGRMGNIKGRPNENDLRDVAERVKGILKI